jgi:hypothetical protein
MKNKKTEIFKLLSLKGQVKLIGSNQINKLKYKTDFDLQEIIKNVDYNKIFKKIQNIFKSVEKMDHIHIMDFKAGSFNSLPVRWNHEQVMLGYQDIDTKKVMLIDALQSDSTIKIDVIAYIDGEFVEYSCNYYLHNNDIKDKSEIYKSLLIDIKKYYHEKKFMKALKRILSYRLIKGDTVDDLIDFFNSRAGLLYQIKHKLEVIIEVKELVLKTKDGSGIIKKSIDNIIKLIPKNIKFNNKDDIEKIIDVLNNEINKLVIDFLN